MRALIADDHPLARRGLALLLREDVGVDEVLEAGGSGEALALARARRPDLVLVDMQMPESLPARELCAHLRALLPDAWLIVVTAFERTGEIRDCLLAGANGCLLKDTAEADLARSLLSVIAGETAIDARVAQRIAAEAVGRAPRHGRPHLTSRERDVLGLLAEGCSNRSIAERLVISETTVKGHVSSLLEKLGASSRLEVVVRASQAGLL